MDYTDLLKLISVFLLSSVKFGWMGVPAAIAAGYSFFKAVTVTTAGGFAGIVFFSYLSEWFIVSAKKIINKKPKKKIKKKFTFFNKLVVRVKRSLGLAGIAFLTPPLFSFPVGVFFAIRYYKNKTKVISYMLVSTICWSVTFYFFYKYLFDSVKAWLGN